MLAVERGKLTAGWDDVGYLRATIVDDQGVVVPYAATPLTFTIAGPGRILTTDSADNADHSGFQKPDRTAYHGSAVVLVRATAATGDVTVSVSGAGLTGASATLHVGQ
jgi:beta-galactosidase